MSVDYNVAHCIGIKLTEEMVDYAIGHGVLNENFWDDPESYFEISNIDFVRFGNYYIGDFEYYLGIPCNRLDRIVEEYDTFIYNINYYFGKTLSMLDIKIHCGLIIS